METKEMLDTVVGKLEGWLRTAIALLPNLALAILCIVITYFAAKFINKYSKKYLIKWHTNPTIAGFLARIFFTLVFFLGITLALSVLDLDRTVASMLAGLGIIGLALGFAFQNTAANLMCGIYITFNHPFRVGDVIKSKSGHDGKVIDINLRVTKIKTWDGPIVYIPNRMLVEEEFVNFTENGMRRVRIDCGVSYGDDLEKVEKVAIAAMQALPSRIQSEEVTLHWKEFGESSINFSVNIWLTYNREELKFVSVKNEAIKALKKAFDEQDIMIPFPIRTLDFGIKGGEKLVEVIENTGFSKFDKNGTDKKWNLSPAERK